MRRGSTLPVYFAPAVGLASDNRRKCVGSRVPVAADQSVVPWIAPVDHVGEARHPSSSELEAKVAHRAANGGGRLGTSPEVLHQSIDRNVLVRALRQAFEESEWQCVSEEARALLPVDRKGLTIEATDGLDVGWRTRHGRRDLCFGQARQLINVLEDDQEAGSKRLGGPLKPFGMVWCHAKLLQPTGSRLPARPSGRDRDANPHSPLTVSCCFSR